MQKTLGLLEQQTSLSIAMEFLSLWPANFSLNRNVALDACRLGPPWHRTLDLNSNLWGASIRE